MSGDHRVTILLRSFRDGITKGPFTITQYLSFNYTFKAVSHDKLEYMLSQKHVWKHLVFIALCVMKRA